jgi:nitrite reductase/ring-hydroxylating ferredoxin subunit
VSGRADDEAWYDLGPAADFPDEKPRGRMIEGLRLCTGRAGDGFFAIDDTCPHAGGSLTEGLIDGDRVICPLHAWAFETESGHCVDDPRCSVRAYPTRVERGIVQVRIPR